MSKPQNFQITINSQQEFDAAWAELIALGYKLTRHESEKFFQGRNSYIKHCSGHAYIWSSTMRDTSKTQYRSFEEFKFGNRSLFKPSMNDVIRLVELDREAGSMQAELMNLQAQVGEKQSRIDAKMAEIKALQQKLNITA